jgi:dTDP-4-dehydrorhamnose reductase
VVKAARMQPIEIWGGPECTVNRVGDEYFDQIRRSGHHWRLNDLDLFAELGIRKLRYPVLWERTVPDCRLRGASELNYDWAWSDERLRRIRELGMDAIVGLLHHGSGPRYTALTDDLFPQKFAAYARAVAERYPAISNYTPINEPLTTARFSGLYGHWYPHKTDDQTFARAFLLQCKAVALAMSEIRMVNPTARLVQTEDLGQTFSTAKLRYQAAFENTRRWLTFDVLSGRLDEHHPLWDYFVRTGIPVSDLLWFRENVCPPDVIGINHYVTSERYLDEHTYLYPGNVVGGNGIDRYVDIEAVRSPMIERLGAHKQLIADAWERYHIPIALTEVHLGCTREEQMRWLRDAYNAAEQNKASGIDVEAVTVWALLGAFDWNSLLRCNTGHYESGVFDVRSPNPRPTALAGLVRELARGGKPSHPAMDGQGWWRKPMCALKERQDDGQGLSAPTATAHSRPCSQRPVLITGVSGTLGTALVRSCETRGLSAMPFTRQELDISNAIDVSRVLSEHQPWAIFNAAGYVRVDAAEQEPAVCYRTNVDGPAVLARECRKRGIRLLTFSSDLVFDGAKRAPYVESDPCNPLNVYGLSKVRAEQKVLGYLPDALVVRTSAFFGPHDRSNFVTVCLSAIASGKPFVAANDTVVSPTYVPDLVEASIDLLEDGATGIWHLANATQITWADWALMVADLAGFNSARIEQQPMQATQIVAKRPAYSALSSERGRMLPDLFASMERYIQHWRLSAACLSSA